MTELKASLETIQATAKELITEIEGHFTELQQQRQAEQEQEAKTKETLLLNGKEDSYGIYQLARREETMDLRFEPFDRLQATGHFVDRANYELVYTAPLTKDMTLGGIWEKFNIDRPADFKGHSLSVSDIVVLHQNGENTAHYVDSIGFQQVPEFLQEQAQQTPVFDKLSPEQQQALSDTVKDTLQLLVDADKRIYGDVTGKTLEAIAAQGYSYKGGQLEKQQPEATPESLNPRKPYDGRNRQNAEGQFSYYRHEPRTDRSGGLWFSSCVGGREVSHYGKRHTGICHSRRAAAAG